MIKAKDGFIIQKMMDAYMIIAIGDAGEHFRDILKTNETGAFYWRQLQEGTTVEQMVDASVERFDNLSRDEAREDIERFLKNVADTIEEN